MKNRFLLIVSILLIPSSNVFADIDNDSGTQLLLNCAEAARALTNQPVKSADGQVKLGYVLAL